MLLRNNGILFLKAGFQSISIQLATKLSLLFGQVSNLIFIQSKLVLAGLLVMTVTLISGGIDG